MFQISSAQINENEFYQIAVPQLKESKEKWNIPNVLEILFTNVIYYGEDFAVSTIKLNKNEKKNYFERVELNLQQASILKDANSILKWTPMEATAGMTWVQKNQESEKLTLAKISYESHGTTQTKSEYNVWKLFTIKGNPVNSSFIEYSDIISQHQNEPTLFIGFGLKLMRKFLRGGQQWGFQGGNVSKFMNLVFIDLHTFFLNLLIDFCDS